MTPFSLQSLNNTEKDPKNDPKGGRILEAPPALLETILTGTFYQFFIA